MVEQQGDKPINVLVVGAGAIGCLVGGRLAAAGHAVTLLGRAGLVKAVQADGLCLRRPGGQAQTVHPQAVESLAALPSLTGFDLLLITVKSFDTATAVAGLAGRLSPAARVLSLQNGVGNEELLTRLLPEQPVLAGSITLPVMVPQTGVVAVSKEKGGIGLAPASEGAAVDDVAQVLQQAGFTVALYADYRSLKWSKLLMNIISNAIPAILDMPPAEALAHPRVFNLELAALRETVAVMRAAGINVVGLPAYPVPLLATLVRRLPNYLLRPILRPMVAGGRGDKLPSLQLDMRRRRNQSEVDVLNKVVAQTGRAVKVATPVNSSVSRILSGIIQGKISRAAFKGNPEALVETVLTQQTG
ncbi:MAG: ketopantoate reductase family protein [Anaerolineae bacterium]